MSETIPTPHPNQVSPRYRTYDIVACIFSFVAAVCVALRFVHRARNRDYMADDWTALLSFIFAIGVLIGTLLISAPSISGAGYHITSFTVPELNTYFKIALATNVLYNWSVAASKASILLFCRRIFAVDFQFRILMYIMAFVIPSNCLAASLGLIFSTNPIQAQWNVGMPSTSINQRLFWATMAVVNIVIDLLLLIVVQVKVWKLQMTLQRKLLVSSVFVLGAFTIITSILRIVTLLTVEIADITYTLTIPGIWTNVEMNLSIIVACAPVIYGLWRTKKTKRQTATSQRSLWRYGRSSTSRTNGNGSSKIGNGQRKSEYLNSEVGLHGASYRTIVESGTQEHSMEPLAQIQVRREYEVNQG